jgi:nitroreductase
MRFYLQRLSIFKIGDLLSLLIKGYVKKIRSVSWGQAQVEEASLLIILVADLMAWNKEPGRYWKDAPKPVQDYLVPAISQYYDGKPKVQRDEAMRSCGMAAMNLMLHAKSMGYDTCPMDGFDFDQVSELLNLPSDHTPAMFVCVGKGIKEAMPRGGQLPLQQVVIHNQFN